MWKTLKWMALGVGALLVAVVAGGGLYVLIQVRAFDASMDRVYDVATPRVTRSSDPEVLARGRHLAEALGGYAAAECHGKDLAGVAPWRWDPWGR